LIKIHYAMQSDLRRCRKYTVSISDCLVDVLMSHALLLLELHFSCAAYRFFCILCRIMYVKTT